MFRLLFTAVLPTLGALALGHAAGVAQTFAEDYRTTLATYAELRRGNAAGEMSYVTEVAAGDDLEPTTGVQGFAFGGDRYYASHEGGFVIQEGNRLAYVDHERRRVVYDSAAAEPTAAVEFFDEELLALFADDAQLSAEDGGRRTYYLDLCGVGGYTHAHMTYDAARGIFTDTRLEYADSPDGVTAVRIAIAIAATPAPPTHALADVLALGTPVTAPAQRLRPPYRDYTLVGL